MPEVYQIKGKCQEANLSHARSSRIAWRVTNRVRTKTSATSIYSKRQITDPTDAIHGISKGFPVLTLLVPLLPLLLTTTFLDLSFDTTSHLTIRLHERSVVFGSE